MGGQMGSMRYEAAPGETRRRSTTLTQDHDLEANLNPLHLEAQSALSASVLAGISSATSSSNPLINIVYHTTVPLKQKVYFEKDWLPKMSCLYETLPGFRYRSVNLLIQTDDVCEYLVIIACNDYPAFLLWETSPQRTKMMSLLKSHHIVTRRLYTTSQDASTPEHGSILPSRAYLKDNLGPTPPSLPPPKWKLCFVIYLGVIMNIFLWSYSGVPLVMATAGLPIGFNLFVSLAISVPILSYAFFPLVMSIPLVSRWLRAPRPERMSAIQKLLDQGLPMFAPKLTPGPSKETVAHFKKLECRLEATRRIQHQISSDLERLRTQLNLERGSHSTSPTIVRSPQDTVRNKVTEGIQRRSIAASDSMKRSKSTPSLANLSLGSDPLPRPNGANGDEEIKEGDHGPITVAVAHWVKWEHILDFDLWTEEITSAMATFEGFLGLTTIVPKSEAEPYINCFTYDTPGHMMKFIDSEIRQSLLMKLTPFLESDSQAQTIVNRIIEDAFTELFVATGDQAEVRPPPIWKSTILTLIPLHIIVWQLGGNVLKILEGNAHLEFNVAIVISTVTTVVFNSYVGVPLMHSQFGEWLRQERTATNEKSWFQFLDTGLSVPARVSLLLVWWSFAIITGSLGLIQPSST